MKKHSIFALCVMHLLTGCTAGRPSLEVAAMRYVGVPYVLDPLGEGEGAAYDTDPIHRTDAFDCLTFVETVLAHATGTDLQKIRYKNFVNKSAISNQQSAIHIDWFRRNHWTEADWIPNAVALGLIKPVEAAHSAKTYARVDLRQWYREKIPSPVGVDSEIIASAKPFEMSVPFVPRGELTAGLLAEMPPQTVVFFIKCGVDNPVVQGDMISHTGFVFGRDLIHAGQKSGVVRIDFLEYMTDSKFCGAAFFSPF